MIVMVCCVSLHDRVNGSKVITVSGESQQFSFFVPISSESQDSLLFQTRKVIENHEHERA